MRASFIFLLEAYSYSYESVQIVAYFLTLSFPQAIIKVYFKGQMALRAIGPTMFIMVGLFCIT